MATGLVIHISSGEDRHTEILTTDHIRIGTSEECELRLRSSSLPPGTSGVLVELIRANGSYSIMSADQSLSLNRNREPIEFGAEVRDGDEIRVSDSDLL